MENINIAEKIEELENALISILKVSKNNFYRYKHPQYHPPHTVLKYRHKHYIILFGKDKPGMEINGIEGKSNPLFRCRFKGLLDIKDNPKDFIFNVSPQISPNVIAKVIQDYEQSITLFKSAKWFPAIKKFTEEMADEVSDIFADWIGDPDEVAERLAELYMKEHNIIDDSLNSKFLPLAIIIKKVLWIMAWDEDE